MVTIFLPWMAVWGLKVNFGQVFVLEVRYNQCTKLRGQRYLYWQPLEELTFWWGKSVRMWVICCGDCWWSAKWSVITYQSGCAKNDPASRARRWFIESLGLAVTNCLDIFWSKANCCHWWRCYSSARHQGASTWGQKVPILHLELS